MPDNWETIYSRLKLINSKDKGLMFYYQFRNLNHMGILFYLVFVGGGLSAAFLIQKALKAIKLI